MSATPSAASGRIARRYAEALLELGQEHDEVSAMGEQLQRLRAVWAESQQLRDALLLPNGTQEAKREILMSLGEKLALSRRLVSAMCLMSDRGRLALVEQLADSFFHLAAERAGLLHAEVSTASTLPEGYFAELKKVLEDVTGKQVVLEHKNDPSLLGGVVTRLGDRVYDGSVKRRLENLREQLTTLELREDD